MPTITKFSKEALRQYLDGRPRKWLENKTRMDARRIRDIFNGVEPKATELILIARAFNAQPSDFMVDIDVAPEPFDLDPTLKRAPGRPRKRVAVHAA